MLTTIPLKLSHRFVFEGQKCSEEIFPFKNNICTFYQAWQIEGYAFILFHRMKQILPARLMGHELISTAGLPAQHHRQMELCLSGSTDPLTEIGEGNRGLPGQ